MTWCRAAPIANNVTNAASLPTNAGQVDIDNLSSTLTDGGVVDSYTITAIPNATTQGVLYYNSTGTTYTAVTANQKLTAAQAATLHFDPAAGASASSAQFSYTATYTATDTGALVSNTATYTIPLQVVTPCVATTTLNFTSRTAGEPWESRPAESVPTGSSVTTISTGAITINNNSAAASVLAVGSQGVNTLRWVNDYAANSTKTSSVTFTFSRAVSNFTVEVRDIDTGDSYQDRVTFGGSNGGTAVTPSLSPVNPNQNYFTISGTTATSLADAGNNGASTDASVVAYFPNPITTLTITYSDGSANTNAGEQAIGIDRMTWCRLAPVANDVTNTSVSNAAGQFPVNNLDADVDGIATYTLTAVPTAAQGVLYVNGVAAAAGQTLTALQATQLSFDPAPAFTGTVSFAYSVSDDANQTDPATYSIPVSASGAAGLVADCANPGRDGSPTISANPNTYFPSTATATQTLTAGTTTSITLGVSRGAATPIAIGDLVLIIQMQGADISSANDDTYGDGVAGGGGNGYLNNANFRAGLYEYAVATSAVPVGGGTLTLATAVRNTYQNTVSAANVAQRKFQVVRVPQYSNLTLGANILPLAWNGSTGGVVAVDVAKTLNLNGKTIDASGSGFRGGAGRISTTANTNTTAYVTTSASNFNGQKGEGIVGTPQYLNNGGALLNTTIDGYPGGSAGRGAPGNAGGGGDDNLFNSGGGGGANGGLAGRGGNTYQSNRPVGGEPGANFLATSSRLILGGGGGAGVTNEGTGAVANGFASSGAAGGGLVMVRTNSVSGTGSILANGTDANSTVRNDGGGGGGAGGSILVTANVTSGLSGLTLSATGGDGGSTLPNLNGGTAHGPGGGGGGGVILTNGSVASATTAGGTNGTTTASTVDGNAGSPTVTSAYGATAGVSGLANALIDNSIANSTSGANCPADVTTTITGPTTLSVGQPAGSYPNYTATFTNNGTGSAANVARTVTLPAGATVTAANLPAGATFTTTGGVTTIDFGATASLATGATNSVSFSFTAPATAGAYALTSNVATDANQGTDAAANSATLTIQVNNTPANCGVSYYDNTNSYSGLSAEYYQGDYNNDVAWFTTRTATDKGVASTINYLRTVANTGGTFPVTTATVNGANNTFSARYRGNFTVTTAGSYTISLSNAAIGNLDDRAQLWIDGAAVIAAGNSPVLAQARINVPSFNTGNPTVTLNLSAGTHNILLYYSATGQPDRVSLSYSGPDSPTLQVIPNTVLCAGLGNIPPIATAVTNSPAMASTNGPTTINTLAGTDQDGTVTNYVITTLPTAAQGVLSLGGTAVTAGQVITAAQAAQLQFDPVLAFSGNASFTFQAVDNTGQYSNNAVVYTIPVTLATTIAGTVFEDANYGGGNGRNLGTAGTVGRPGATVELYDAAGNFVSSAVTAANGTYSLGGATTAGNYTVRVVSSSVTSARTGGTTPGLVPVQTFVRNGVADNVNRVGGEAPEKQDAAANTGTQTLAALTAGTLTPQSISTVSLTNASTPVSTVDFGFNFDVVTNTNDAGQGSLRQFITNANALGGEASLAQSGSSSVGALAVGKETSIFMIPSGAAVNGLRAGLTSGLTGGVAVIAPATALPAISGPDTYLDGSTQTFNVGNTNNVALGAGGTVGTGTGATALSQVNGPEVQLVGNLAISSGLNIAAAATGTNVIGLSVYGFGNTNNGNVGDNDVTGNIISAADNFSLSRSVVGTSATSFTTPNVPNPATNVRVLSGANVTITNNLVGFSGLTGIRVASVGTTGVNGTGTRITNNEIRGSAQANVTYDGLQIRGGGVTATGNLFVANSGQGVDMFNSVGSNILTSNTLTGNGVGNATTAPSETAAIRIIGAGNTVSLNVINDNYGAGVQVQSNGTAVISQNSIYGNGTITSANNSAASGQIGIDLTNTTTNAGTAPYVTINDSGDGDTGGNGLLNFPVITSSTIVGNNLVVTGFARPGALIELFGTGTADPSGFGEGRTYLGSFTEGSGADSNGGTGPYGSGTVNGLNQGTDNTNRFTFTIPLTGSFATVTAGTVLTSTATLANNTSEFSGNVAVNTAPVPRDVTNVAVANNSGPVVLSPNLTATANGTANGVANTIVSYTVSPASTGTLFYNNVAVTAATVVPAGSLGLLTYQPVAGSTATATFTYTATDANGVTSTTHLNQAGTTTTTGPATYTIPVNAAADVTTTLAGPLNLNPGQPTGTYTVTFTNNGPNQAATVTQQVTLPVGATSVVFPTGATYNPMTRVIDFGTATTLNGGATNSFGFSFTAPTTPGSVSLVSNVTTATSQGVDSAPNSATLNLTIGNPANVAATISADASPITAGQTATFNVSFSNAAGSATATGVVASVQLPAGLGTVSATNGVYDNATGVVTYAGITSIGNGGSTPSVITFTAPATGPVTATASISTTTNEAGQTANNTQSAFISVTPAYNVATTITGPTTTAVGVQTTFSVMTINNGPSMAPNVAQTVQLPAGLTNVYVSNGGTYDSGSGVVTFPTLATLANGARVDNTISFTPVAATGFTALATVVANTNNAGDTNPANNSASAAATTVNAAPAAATNANIYTTITTPSANVAPGATTILTVTSGNRGAATANSVAQQTTLPAGLSNVVILDGNNNLVANTATTGYNSATGVVIVPAVASVVSGATTSYSISFTAPASGVVAAVATISANNADSMPADNISTVDVTVNPATDLAVVLTGPTSAAMGQSLTYTVTTTNKGPVTATNVVPTVAIPAGLPAGSVTVSGGGSYNSATGLVTFPAINSQAVGSVVSNTITYTAPTDGPLVNVASVSSATLETTLANNGSTVTTSLQRSSDVVVYLNGPATLVAGNSATYTVTTTNNGPSAAASETTTVQLPTGLSNVVVRDAAGAVIANAYNAATGVVTLATLTNQLPGAAGTVSNTISFTVPTGVAELTVAASAAVSDATNDAVLTNNSATAIATVSPATTTTTDLQTTLTADVTTQAAGSAVVFTVSSLNNGPNPAANVMQRLTLPAGLTGVTVSNGGTYDTNTGIVTFPTVTSQASTTTTPYTVTVNAPGAASLTAVASISSATSDTDPANNLISINLPVTNRTDVAVALNGPTAVVANQSATYVVAVTNNGPSLATSTTTVQFPAGLTVMTISDGGTYDAGTGIVTFPAITNQVSGPNGVVTYTITAQAPAAIPNGASFNLVATLTPASGTNDQVAANNSATLTVSKGNLAPVANAVVNTLRGPQGNTAGALAISPLSGSDADGNINSYTITSIPDATTQGVLRLNGTAVAAGTPVPANQIANLTFDPVGTFVGNAFFTYTVTDNAGAVSAPAIYTIPVGQDLSAEYTPIVKGGAANPYLNGDVVASVFDVNGGAYNNAAPQAVTDTGIRTATLISGPLPAGTSLSPVTGLVTVTDRTLLVPGSYPVTITTIDANGGTNTNTFTIVIGANPLPVELKTFEVRAVKVDALLDWTTASEKSNDHFDVERSLNGTTFEKIGTVRGQGTTQATTAYSFTDAGIGARTQSLVYYRLRQVDLDGTVSYSPVRTVRFEAPATATAKLSVFPNPATTTDRVVTLDLSTLPKGTYQAALLDATGRTLGTYPVEGGINKTIDVQNLATGTYLVVVRGNGLKLSQRLIKE